MTAVWHFVLCFSFYWFFLFCKYLAFLLGRENLQNKDRLTSQRHLPLPTDLLNSSGSCSSVTDMSGCMGRRWAPRALLIDQRCGHCGHMCHFCAYYASNEIRSRCFHTLIGLALKYHKDCPFWKHTSLEYQ